MVGCLFLTVKRSLVIWLRQYNRAGLIRNLAHCFEPTFPQWFFSCSAFVTVQYIFFLISPKSLCVCVCVLLLIFVIILWFPKIKTQQQEKPKTKTKTNKQKTANRHLQPCLIPRHDVTRQKGQSAPSYLPSASFSLMSSPPP